MGLKYYTSPFHATETKEVADLLLLKTQLCGIIKDYLQSENWTQKEAAKILGVTQPKVSDIVNGKVDRITMDRIIEMLYKLGFNTRAEESQKDFFSIHIERTTCPLAV